MLETINANPIKQHQYIVSAVGPKTCETALPNNKTPKKQMQYTTSDIIPGLPPVLYIQPTETTSNKSGNKIFIKSRGANVA
jgi:hypothetical protein